MSVPHPHRSLRAFSGEVHHLRDLERAGDSAATPLIALLGLLALIIVPAFLLLLGIGFAAYYLAA